MVFLLRMAGSTRRAGERIALLVRINVEVTVARLATRHNGRPEGRVEVVGGGG
jgi:hypothetical protein